MSNGGGFYRKPRASFSMKQIGNPVLVEFVDKTRAVLRFQGARLKSGTSPDASNIEVYLLGKDDVETTVTLDKITAVYPERPARKPKLDAQGNPIVKTGRKSSKSVPLSELAEVNLGDYAIEDFDLDHPQTDEGTEIAEPTDAEIDAMIEQAIESDAQEVETGDEEIESFPSDAELTYEPVDDYIPAEEDEPPAPPAKKPSRKPKK